MVVFHTKFSASKFAEAQGAEIELPLIGKQCSRLGVVLHVAIMCQSSG